MMVALTFLVLGLTGCTNDTFTRLGFPNPITEQGKTVLALWQGSWIAGLAVGFLVWGLILWAVIFHRKRGDRLPPQVRYNMPIEIMYTAVPFVLIAVFFYFTAKDENYIDSLPANPAVTVNVLGFQWSWQFNYPQYHVTNTGDMCQGCHRSRRRNHGPFGLGQRDGTGVGGLLVRLAGRLAAAEQASPTPGHEPAGGSWGVVPPKGGLGGWVPPGAGGSGGGRPPGQELPHVLHDARPRSWYARQSAKMTQTCGVLEGSRAVRDTVCTTRCSRTEEGPRLDYR